MNFFSQIESLVSEVFKRNFFSDVIFLSLGSPEHKARVIRIKGKNDLTNKVFLHCLEYKKNAGKYPTWIKIDFIDEVEVIPFSQLHTEMVNTRRNYIDFGFSLDEDFILSFLPEEINANAFLKPSDNEKAMILSEKNINAYLKEHKFSQRYKKNKKENFQFRIQNYKTRLVKKFYTTSHFLENGKIIELISKGYKKGLRPVENLNNEIDNLIKFGTAHLQNQIQDNGKYVYGYFPHFDRKISFYNNLRHSSSTYSLIEGLTYQNKSLEVAQKPIDYIIENYLFYHEGAAYVFDDTNNLNEIKLGQNAAFVFAVCELIKSDPSYTSYLKNAQQVARGILEMVNPNTAETIHVLEYPTLTIKEDFRVIYYDGEAALALLRLYQLDKNPIWLKTVERLFERFISEKYWKHHDHWLGYCTNELVQITEDPKYFEFGVRNVASYLDYIKNRETTFPTFLEMLMATYNLVQLAKKRGLEHIVSKHMDEQYFLEVIHHRADYQRVGFFYPELAMYFKNPSRILNSFFIKHHGYRVRIDDVEHYISGYIQYQKAFKDNK